MLQRHKSAHRIEVCVDEELVAVCARARDCPRPRFHARVTGSVSVCVSVCVRARAWACVCVCVCPIA